MKKYLPSIIAGILLTLSFPPLKLFPLAWVCFCILVHKTLRDKSSLHFFIGGIAFHSTNLFWIHFLNMPGIPKTFLYPGVIVLWIYLSLWWWLKGYIVLQTHRLYGKSTAILLFPFIAVAIDFLPNLGSSIAFPWCLPAYTQTFLLPFIQWASIGGTPLVSWGVYMVNALLLLAIQKRKLPYTIGVLGFLSVWCIGGALLSIGVDKSEGDTIRIAIFQPNTPPDVKIQGSFPERMRYILQSMSRLKGEHIDMGILPESSIPCMIAQSKWCERLVKQTFSSYPFPLVAGFLHREVENKYRSRIYNAGGLIQDGKVVFLYKKHYLVPFGERLPFDDIFPALKRIDLGQGRFWPGTDYTVMEYKGIRFSMFICFESIFPRLIRRFVNKGAEFLINITEDMWFGRTPAPYQHMEIARLRAVEHRRCVVRCANAGISCFIMPSGKVIHPTKLFTQTAIVHSIPVRRSHTLYARLGDWFAWMCVIIFLFILYKSLPFLHHPQP